MKNFILLIALSICSLSVLAQTEITAGQNKDVVVSTKARYAVGTEILALRVTDANDPSLVGLPIMCKVMETRRSNMAGQEGRMVLRPLYIQTKDKAIELNHDDIYLRGKNRANIKFWIPIAFWAGSGVKIGKNDTFKLTIKE